MLSRRHLLGASAVVAIGAGLSACGTKTANSQATTASKATDKFPVNVAHVYGTTTIKAEPKRVVSISSGNEEAIIALGVVPVAMPANTWGGNKNKSLPWKDEALTKLGAAPGSANYPKQFTSTDSLPIQEIAGYKPDLIVAALSGISKEEYEQLSKIAPTIAYSKTGGAWTTPWNEVTTMVGQALGRSAKAKEVVDAVNAQFAQVAKQHPKFKGATFITGAIGSADHSISLYMHGDNRSRFFQALGLVQAPVVAAIDAKSQTFYADYSAEQADKLVADVFHAWVDDEKAAAAIKADPLLSKIPAVANASAILDYNKTDAMSISAFSALSASYALKSYVPRVAKVLEK